MRKKNLSIFSVLVTFISVAVAGNSFALAAPAERAESRVATVQARLDATQLQICQNRQDRINNAFARIVDRNKKKYEFITTIGTRTEAFYVKSGKTITNYSQLVGDINTVRTAAQTAISAEELLINTFQCTGDNPKGTVQTFQTAHKTTIKALQDYKAAIRTLLVTIKQTAKE